MVKKWSRDKFKRVAAYCRVSTIVKISFKLSLPSKILYRLINENPDWTMAGIYADEAITGTQ